MKLKILFAATTLFLSTKQYAAQIDPNIKKYTHLERFSNRYSPLMILFAAGPNDDKFPSLEFVLNHMRNRLTDSDLDEALEHIDRNARINPNYGFKQAAEKVKKFKNELAAGKAKPGCCTRITSYFR